MSHHANYLEDLASFKKALVDAGDKLVVLDFTATWCPPCKAIAPFFEQLAGENAGAAFFYKVDVDQNADTAKECKIECMPTFQFFKNGSKIDEFSGASQDKLREKVNQHK